MLRLWAQVGVVKTLYVCVCVCSSSSCIESEFVLQINVVFVFPKDTLNAVPLDYFFLLVVSASTAVVKS